MRLGRQCNRNGSSTRLGRRGLISDDEFARISQQGAIGTLEYFVLLQTATFHRKNKSCVSIDREFHVKIQRSSCSKVRNHFMLLNCFCL